MASNIDQLRIRSLQDNTMSRRLGNGPAPSLVWWNWYKRTLEAIHQGVSDANLPKEPSSQD